MTVILAIIGVLYLMYNSFMFGMFYSETRESENTKNPKTDFIFSLIICLMFAGLMQAFFEIYHRRQK